MIYNTKTKRMLLPLIALLIAILMTVSVAANALCPLCQGYNKIYCTGVDTTHTYSHRRYVFFGDTCYYSPPSHAVATQCCNASWGSHYYQYYEHPASWCNRYEEEFPCSEVPNWVMDP